MGRAPRSPARRERGSSRISPASIHLLVVRLLDVVEIGGDREALALARELVGGDVDEELVPPRLVEIGLDRVGVDAGIPIELLDDAVGLDLRAGLALNVFLIPLPLPPLARA